MRASSVAEHSRTALSVGKDRLGLSTSAGKSELTPKGDVVFDPVIDLNHKLAEIVTGYKASSDDLWTI